MWGHLGFLKTRRILHSCAQKEISIYKADLVVSVVIQSLLNVSYIRLVSHTKHSFSDDNRLNKMLWVYFII